MDSYGRTPLLYACKLGNRQTVQMLLKYKANVNVVNATGDSCMSFAQKSGNEEVVMMLIEAGMSLRPMS